MISFSTWRAIYRVPLLRENRDAVRILSDMFYLLIALYRANRIQDFFCLTDLYFEMIDSFMKYGSASAKKTLDDVLKIAWFRTNKRHLFRLILAYKRATEKMRLYEGEVPPVLIQKSVNEDRKVFFESLKALIDFDGKDEARIAKLTRQGNLRDAFSQINQALGYQPLGLSETPSQHEKELHSRPVAHSPQQPERSRRPIKITS